MMWYVLLSLSLSLSLYVSFSVTYAISFLPFFCTFYLQCDIMYDQEDEMVQDYLNNIDFENMCTYAGVCWMGLCLPSC